MRRRPEDTIGRLQELQAAKNNYHRSPSKMLITGGRAMTISWSTRYRLRRATMRNQRRHGATNRESIVNAGLAIVDDVGLEGLTIRAVATVVDVPPMSLYTHFSNKEELLDLMYAEVARRLYADAGHPTWETELFALCQQLHDILLEHPHWIPLLSRPVPATAVPLRERLLRLLANEGMSPPDALATVSRAALMSIGLVLVELTFREPDGRSSVTSRIESVKRWFEEPSTITDHPTTASAFAEMSHLDLRESFMLTIRTFIAGLKPRPLAQQQG
jgi:AcrR family transcriptional regulator